MQPLKILFIKPFAYTPNQAIDIPLGVLYLSAYLKKFLKAPVQTRLLDLRIQKNRKKLLTNTLENFRPDMIGISLLGFEQSFLKKHLETIRIFCPHADIIVGGPYATTDYPSIVADHYPAVSCAVIGEGEAVLLNLVNNKIKGRPLQEVNGIAYYDGTSVVLNEKEPFITDLDTIPVPDYSLVTMSDYWNNLLHMNPLLAEKKYMPVISTRGCPYQCAYCHNIFGKHLRQQSAGAFLDHLRFLYDHYGIKEFHIVDDIFNFDRVRMRTILNGIIDQKMDIKLSFPNGVRGDLLDRGDMDLLKQAGAYMLIFAIETASPRIQHIIHKNLNIQKVMNNITYARSIGLITQSYFMIGFPGETVEEIKETITLAVRSKLDFAFFFTVIPFPHTRLFELARDCYPGFHHAYGSSYLTGAPFYQQATGFRIKRLQKLAYIRFYTPRRVAALFVRIPRKGRFVKTFLKRIWGVITN